MKEFLFCIQAEVKTTGLSEPIKHKIVIKLLKIQESDMTRGIAIQDKTHRYKLPCLRYSKLLKGL